MVCQNKREVMESKSPRTHRATKRKSLEIPKRASSPSPLPYPNNRKAQVFTSVTGDGGNLKKDATFKRRKRNLASALEICAKESNNQITVLQKAVESKSSDNHSDDALILNCLPKELLESIKSKEKKLRDHGSQEYLEAETRRRHVKALPQLLDIVHVIFLSYGKSIMAHAELMHRISASQKTKGDSKEIDEQLQLLVDMVPEAITSKLSLKGDVLYRLDKLNIISGRKKLTQFAL